MGTLTSVTSNQIVIKLDKQPTSKSRIRILEDTFKKIRGVLLVTYIPLYLNIKDTSLNESLRTNRCRFVFDIDSTLTRGGPGTIHHKIEDVFNKMVEKGIRIYLATGRSMPDLNKLIKEYPVEKYPIAENGGILLGFGPDNYLEFGNKTEPNKVLEYLQVKYQIPEDMAQGERLTEVIFLQKNVTLKRIAQAIKARKAKVDIHASKNSFHISKRGINKGSAMLELGKRLHWNNQMIIAVGDADMDIPMFKNADYSFAVGNASKGAKRAASKVLKGKYEQGIKEIYDLINKV